MKLGSPLSAGLKPLPGPARPTALPLVGGGVLPLAFILLGVGAFAGSAAWLLTRPELLTLPYLHPHIVAFVHLWLPGFLLSVCIGAIYQLMPVVLGEPMKISVSLLWIHFSVHTTGTLLLVAAFATGQFAWAGAGGTLIVIGAGILLAAVPPTFLRAPRRDAPAWCFPIATGWLVATVVVGVALAINRRASWLPLSAVDLLRAHAHLGLAGFFLTLLQGTTFQLVPMFTMGELRRPRFVWTGLLATQVGLLALTPGLAWNLPVFTVVGCAILLTGLGASAVALRATLASRRRRKLDPGIRAFLVGACILGIAALVGAALALSPPHLFGGPRPIAAYGLLIIRGALSLMILGMLCKIVPFLVWMRAYGPKVGKQSVPIATALSARPLEHAWLIAHLVGLGLLVAGKTTSGAVVLAGATTLFLANLLRVLAHLRRREPITLSS